MLRTASQGPTTHDARMLAAADRLFEEFDRVPILTVVRAMAEARSVLRDRGDVPRPDEVESMARDRLRSDQMTA